MGQNEIDRNAKNFFLNIPILYGILKSAHKNLSNVTKIQTIGSEF